jgi:hypothetical protein
MKGDHHAIGDEHVEKITSIWLGEISSHKRPGPRAKKIEPLIDAVEWAMIALMIALMKPCLNERKQTFPPEPFAIINRWWSPADYETPIEKQVTIWPDVIECAGADAPAHLCWLREGKVRSFRRPV